MDILDQEGRLIFVKPRQSARVQARPQIFDLEIDVPDVLYEEVVEVDEEVLLPLGEEPDRCPPSPPPPSLPAPPRPAFVCALH